MYYAHSLEEDDNPEHWQKLEDHLQQVASRARDFAAAFDSAPHGFVAGMWHDIGKFLWEFQRRLAGERIAIEHSGLGAALACSKNKELGLFLAFVIAGHHTGLANWISTEPGLPSPLQTRIKINAQKLSAVLPEIPQHIASLMPPDLPEFLKLPPGQPRTDQQAWIRRNEFWIRFLFSALIDADRLDTEAFASPQVARLRGGFASIPQLRIRLDAFIDQKIDALPSQDSTSPVNRARAQVLSQCRNQAEELPGIFSLTVPTGGGKTLSAMSFALRHAEKHDLRRVIVVIPYTSIIEQNAAVYREALGPEAVIEHHSNLDPLDSPQNHETTRKHNLASENWEAPVIVTTTVQFFESLFSNRPSRCRKLHNIARSVIILDEVQTLPPGFLNSILDALNELVAHYGCSIVLSTATPPALAIRERFEIGLKNIRPIISDPQALTKTLKRVAYTWPDPDEPPIEWETLADELANHPRVLAIVHKRQDARILAEMLQAHCPEDPSFHLSALMCPAHRSDMLAQIRETLVQNAPCRTVSTQLVEAGVDLDFPVVYRALGGLDSIVQAAGRCNREGKETLGQVIVFQAPTSPPPGTPRKALETTLSLLRETGQIDPDTPEIFERYFRMLYFAETLDAHEIQKNRQELNFATVGRDFKLIEDGYTRSVIVPYGISGERLDNLRRQGPSRQTLRALQPFLVNIYPQAFNLLMQAGAIEEVSEGLYAILPIFQNKLYDPQFGLLLDAEAPIPDPGQLIA